MIDKKRLLYFAIIDIVIFFVILFFFLISQNYKINEVIHFVTLNFFLLIYIIFNIYKGYKTEGSKIFASTLFIFYIFHFVIQCTITNLGLIRGFSLPFVSMPYIIKSEYIYIISCVFFTLGYNSKINNFFYNRIKNIRTEKILFKSLLTRHNMSQFKTILLLLFSIGVYTIAISMGIIGYSRANSFNDYSVHFRYQQFFEYSKEMLFIAFYSLYLELCIGKKSGWIKVMFFISTITIIAFGLLNGMKVELFAPFAFLPFIDILTGKKINKKTIIIVPILLFISYQIITPYRNAMRENPAESRIELLQETIQNKRSSDYGNDKSSFLEEFTRRANQTESCAVILYYCDKVGINKDDPKFLSDLIISPISFLIPRAIFSNKPINNYGLWVTQTVYGQGDSAFSFSYITIEGYLYLAGGILAIAICLFLMGVLSKLCTLIFTYHDKNKLLMPIFLISYILILRTVYFEPSDPVELLVGLLRNSIMYPIIVSLFYVGKRGYRFKN